MDSKEIYVEVILPLPVEGTFTYAVPDRFQKIVKGQRVVVQFGLRKLYTAIVLDVHNTKPNLYQAKDIISVIDEIDLVSENQLIFWKWISSYYMSKLGDVMNVALPSSLKLASESKIIIHSNFDIKLMLYSPDKNSLDLIIF